MCFLQIFADPQWQAAAWGCPAALRSRLGLLKSGLSLKTELSVCRIARSARNISNALAQLLQTVANFSISSSDAPSDASPISCENCAKIGSTNIGAWPSSSWTFPVNKRLKRVIIQAGLLGGGFILTQSGSFEWCGSDGCRMYCVHLQNGARISQTELALGFTPKSKANFSSRSLNSLEHSESKTRQEISRGQQSGRRS